MKTLWIESTRMSDGARWDVAYNVQQSEYRRLQGLGSGWVRLGELAEITDGPRSAPPREDGIPLLRLSDLQAGEVVLEDAQRVDGQVAAKHRLQPGDVLLSKAGEEPQVALIGDACPEATFAGDIYRLRPAGPAISPAWLSAFLRTRYASEVLAAHSYGSRIRRLSVADLRGLALPLPPLALADEVAGLERQAAEHSAAARAMFAATIRSLYAEIDTRLGEPQPARSRWLSAPNAWLRERWDINHVQGRRLADALARAAIFRPLGEWASAVVSSRRDFDPEQEVGFVQVSDLDARYMTFSRLRKARVRELPARVRLPLREYQVLLLASGSSLGEASHPVAVVEPHLDGCLASNAFMALEFKETPLYFGLALRHPLVLAQLRRLASGTVIQLIGKREVERLLIPVLGSTWRQDHNDRARIAWEKRRLALDLRQRAVARVEAFIAEALAG